VGKFLSDINASLLMGTFKLIAVKVSSYPSSKRGGSKP
jgi:hypothetical protein